MLICGKVQPVKFKRLQGIHVYNVHNYIHRDFISGKHWRSIKIFAVLLAFSEASYRSVAAGISRISLRTTVLIAEVCWPERTVYIQCTEYSFRMNKSDYVKVKPTLTSFCPVLHWCSLLHCCSKYVIKVKIRNNCWSFIVDAKNLFKIVCWALFFAKKTKKISCRVNVAYNFFCEDLDLTLFAGYDSKPGSEMFDPYFYSFFKAKL